MRTLGKAVAIPLLGGTAGGAFLGCVGGFLGTRSGELLARVLDGTLSGAVAGLGLGVVALPVLGPLAFLRLRATGSLPRPRGRGPPPSGW